MTDRAAIVNVLKGKREPSQKGFRIIDIGCPGLCAGCWSQGLVDAVANLYIEDAESDCRIRGETFNLDFELPSTWDTLIAYVDRFGQFDYAVSTHVVEDLTNDPRVFASLLSKVAKAGYLATPSKFVELQRFERDQLPKFGWQREQLPSLVPWRGYYHHSWVMTLHGQGRDAKMYAVPKLPILELNLNDDCWSKVPAAPLAAQWLYNEIRVYWQSDLLVEVVKVGYYRTPHAWLSQAYYILINATLHADRKLFLRGRQFALMTQHCRYLISSGRLSTEDDVCQVCGLASLAKVHSGLNPCDML